MSKLGFTFYPKDWWSSDTYFDLTAIQRYIYLECLFVMYSNDGFMKTQKTQFENRIRTKIDEEDWNCVVEKFEEIDGQYTHISVNSRLRKAVTNRENGKKGGRPPKPTKPKTETQNNPPLEREREIERESKREIESECEKKEESHTPVFQNSYGKQPIENLKKNCAAHSSWLDSIGMKNSLLPHQVLEWFEAFVLHLLSTGKTEETESEFKRYCSSWISSEIRQGRKPRVENQSKDAQSLTHEEIALKVIEKKYGKQQTYQS